jgi:hypothetical protein
MEIGRREWVRAVFVFVEERKRFNTEDTEEDHRAHGEENPRAQPGMAVPLKREMAEAAAPEG